MRTLYESILDTDIQAQNDTLDKPLQELIKFLKLGDPRVTTCKYEIKNGKLYISSVKNRARAFLLKIVAGKVVNKTSMDMKLDVDIFNSVYFDGVSLFIDTSEIVPFLANCNNCVITYKGLSREAYQGLDKVLSKTKGNQINIWSTEEITPLLDDYSCISNLNLSNCKVILYYPTDLSTIKNLTARELIIQRGCRFEKDGPIFEADQGLSDYFVQKLDEFLARNHIISFGMTDAFVQYVDWFVKKGNDYEIKLLRLDIKRVPKVK